MLKEVDNTRYVRHLVIKMMVTVVVVIIMKIMKMTMIIKMNMMRINMYIIVTKASKGVAVIDLNLMDPKYQNHIRFSIMRFCRETKIVMNFFKF